MRGLDLLPVGFRWEGAGRLVLVMLGTLPQVIPNCRGVRRSRQAQGPREHPSPLSEVEALLVTVQGRTAARLHPARIGGEHPAGTLLDRHHTQQVGTRCPVPAPDAGPGGDVGRDG